MLTRFVFPELNSKLKSSNVKVVPVDLRWGHIFKKIIIKYLIFTITKEDTSNEGLGALEHCLLEIDNSRPFFISIIGQRYGWIPDNYRTSDLEKFDWVKEVDRGLVKRYLKIEYNCFRNNVWVFTENIYSHVIFNINLVTHFAI